MLDEWIMKNYEKEHAEFRARMNRLEIEYQNARYAKIHAKPTLQAQQHELFIETLLELREAKSKIEQLECELGHLRMELNHGATLAEICKEHPLMSMQFNEDGSFKGMKKVEEPAKKGCPYGVFAEALKDSIANFYKNPPIQEVFWNNFDKVVAETFGKVEPTPEPKYRNLEIGEIVQLGDEVFIEGEWIVVPAYVGVTVVGDIFRRLVHEEP